MASGMPEIGSKISLISKADIRYEGKLFTVDPNECTIALSHVRSFGTEDRQTQYPVPAQNQIYEYILFRGSDIKDISIVNTQQLPNDPAIVSGHVQPSLPPYGYNPPLSMPQYGSYGAAPGMGRTMGKSAMSSELPPQDPPPIQVPIPGPGPPGPIVPIVKEPNTELLAGSRSSTPSLSRKSPTNDQAIQTTPPHKDKKVIQPPVPREGRQSRNNERNYQEGYQPRRDYRNQREDNYRGERPDYRPRDQEYRGRDQEYRGRDQEYRGREQEYRARDQEYRVRDQEYRGQRDGDYRGPRDQDRRDMYMNQQRGQPQGMGRGGWVNRGRGGPGPNMRGAPRGRGGPGGNFNRAPGTNTNPNQQNNAGGPKKNTLKFDEEYDFDKANSEFEELTKKTAKLKIAVEGEEKPKVNGEDKKDDSGNETGLGEPEHDEDTDQENTIFYDKAKSFFDNISCEAIERSKGRSQRTDWRTERKLNSETFGVASARRGGYRGRGGYYRGGMYRGGYRGYNPRGQQNRSHINQPRHVQPHSQQQAPTAAAK